MRPLACPEPGCSGTVTEISIETYESGVYVDDETGQIAEPEEDNRERTDCYTDRYVCTDDSDHYWDDTADLAWAIKGANDEPSE
jgi:hypothetical protein